MGCVVTVVLAVLVAAAGGAFRDPIKQVQGGPETQPVPTPNTIAEQLHANEKVWIIGENGMPLVPTRTLPDCFGAPVARNGYTALSSAGRTYIEVSAEPLPWPVRLRAECAITFARDDDSEAGVYAGGKQTPLNNKVFQTLVTAGMLAPEPVPFWHSIMFAKEQSGFALRRWHDTAPGSRRRYPPVKQINWFLSRDDTKLGWRPIDLVIHPESISGSVAGMPLATVYGPITPGVPRAQCIQTELDGVVVGEVPPGTKVFHPPYIGDGIGFYVFNAEAVFRKMTLERVHR